MTGRLEGKVALITGGTTGIGRASAELFRQEGAAVIVTGTNPANLQRAADELGVEAIKSDVSSNKDLDALMATIRDRHGRVDIVFANAGIGGEPMLGDIEEADFERIMAVNCRGVLFTVQKALPLMVEGGSIILTSSIGAHLGINGGLVYSASKGAVRSMARSLAATLVPRRIRVNTLTPGLVRTPIFDKMPIPAETIIHQLVQGVPMGRAAEPIEAARGALFLASDESSFMTGAELKVSGGQTDL